MIDELLMSDSPEHVFISQSLNSALTDYSDTRLLGVTEAQRRTFDYGCMLLRDFTRPLVSQVLWSHSEGIEKDIRTLLFDGGASLKLYFVRDNVRNRARIDEILRSYPLAPSTRPLLRGLRIIPVPDGFDADSQSQQAWMMEFVREGIANDLLFGIVFGKLTAFDISTFSDHGGILGLKFAALHVVTTSGLEHTPTFQREVGARGSSLREVLTMLTSTGLIARVGNSVMRLPTLKGRFLLDLGRRIMFERQHRSHWSEELRSMLRHLQVEVPRFGDEIDRNNVRENVVNEIVTSIAFCKSQFGIDLMDGVDLNNPRFYSEIDWRKFSRNGAYGISGNFWNDTDDLDHFRG